MEIIKITPDNISELKSIYSAFCKNAKEDYLFEVPPIPFQDFMMNFKDGFIEGYLGKNPTVDAFLLYTTSLGNAIEITLLYTKLSYYRGDYAQATVNQMIDEFNYYTSKVGLLVVRENGAQLQGMFDAYKK